MISYDSYKNRIEKVAKVKAFIERFKFLIIGILCVLIAGITVLLVMKGAVTSAMVLPAQITYGDEYEPTSATAFLSGVSYEYSLQGTDEWSEEKPLKVGKYYARTVTDKAIGKGYGEPVGFEILPKEVEFVLNDVKMTYGTDPQNYSLNGIVTAYGDRIRTVDFDYSYNDESENYSEWTVDVTVGAGRVRVVDKNGEDASYCYTYGELTKTLALQRRAISVRLKASSSVYSGSVIDYSPEIEETSKNMLANGDNIVFETEVLKNGASEVILNAGTYTVKITSARIYSGEEDVTHRYDVGAYAGSTYEVKLRPVTVSTDGDNKTYDGTPLSNSGGSADGLATGHRLEFTSSAIQITNVRESTYNVREYVILDKDGEDVTFNYFATADFGALTITPRPVTVSTGSSEKVYDGTALINHEATSRTDLGHDIYASFSDNIVNVSDTATGNNVATVQIYDGLTNITSNYSITYNYGTLTVTQRPVTITTGSAEKVYDGTALTNREATSQTDLGHYISASFKNNIVNVSDTATGNNVATVQIYNGSAVVTDNYKITYNFGTLTVTPLRVSVTTATDSSHVYDGTPYSNSTYTVTYTDNYGYTGTLSNRLLGTDKLTVTSYKTVTAVSDNAENNNVCGYSVPNENYKIIGITYGTLTVQKREITVKTPSYSKTYDGTAISDSDPSNCTVKYGNLNGLVGSDKLKLTSSYISPSANAGSYDNLCSFSEPNENYKIIGITYGTLTINKSSVTVALNNLELTYGDEINYGFGGEKITGTVASGEKLEVINVDINAHNAGVYAITAQGTADYYKVTKSDGTDSTANYSVAFTKGTLTINELEITVELNDVSVTYGDNYVAISKYPAGTGNYKNANELTLPYGEKLAVVPFAEKNGSAVYDYCIDAGAYDINATQANIYDKYGYLISNGSANYKITFIKGTLTVEKREITIQLNSFSAVYGESTAYKGGNEEITSLKGLAFSDRLGTISAKPDCGATPDTGAYKVTCTQSANQILKSDGTDSTANYKISFTQSTLTVEKREITIQLNSYSAVYGESTAYKGGNEQITSLYKLAYSDKLGTISAVPECGATPDVGNYKVNCTQSAKQILKSDGTDSTANYTIKFEQGTLTVTQREITVQPNDITATYGVTPVYEVKAGNYKKVSSGSLVDGETLTINYIIYHSLSTRGDVGEYTFDVYELYGKGSHFSILKSDGTDGTGNYSVTFTSGTLTVTARKITVTIDSVSCNYGTVLYGEYALKPTNKTAQVGGGDGLVYGDELSAVYSYLSDGVKPDRYDVGSYIITLDTAQSYFTYKDGVRQTAKNYEIETVNDGTLTVTPRKITVTFKELAYDYGDIQSNGGGYVYWVMGGESTYLLKEDIYGLLTVGGDGLAVGEYFSVITFYAGETVYDAGDYTLSLYGFVINPSDDNYIVTPKNDLSLTINPKKVTVEVKEEVIYGNYEKALDGVTVTVSEGLAFNETLTLTGFALADGKDDYRIGVFGSPYAIDSAGTQTFFDGNGALLEDGAKNYEITVKGTLTVKPRDLVIGLLDLNGVDYGDAPEYAVDFGNYNLLGGSLAYGQKLKIQVWWKNSGGGVSSEIPSLNAGTYEYVLGNGVSNGTGFYENDGKTTVDYGNYLIICNDVKTVTINPLRVLINPSDATNKEYDGNPYEYPTGFNNCSFGNGLTELPYGEQIAISVQYLSVISQSYYSPLDGAPVSVGEYAYRFEKVVGFRKGTNGQAVETNYIFTESNYERFEITPRQVALTADGVTVIYGENMPDITATGDRLVSGHKVSVDKWHFLDSAGNTVYVPRNAGEYTIVITSAVAFNGSDNVSENYDFSYGDGKLTIKVREITVTPDCDGKVYDGEVITVSGYYDFLTSDTQKAGFVYGDEADFSFEYIFYDKDGEISAPKNAGSYSVSVKVSGESDNYKISCAPLTFEIEKRAVKVVTASGEKEYDGTALINHTLTSDADDLMNKLGQKFVGSFTDNIVNVSQTADKNNVVTVEIFEGEENVSSNYEISYDYGTFKITKRNITIELLEISDRDYDGTEEAYSKKSGNFTSIFGSTVAGEELTVFVKFSSTPKNAGKYTYGYDYGEVSGGEIDNYEIICPDEKSFEIFKRDLTVELSEIEDKDYDGNQISYGGDETVNGLAEDETLTVVISYYDEDKNLLTTIPIDAGTYYYSLNLSDSTAGGCSVGTNYSVNCIEKSFTISKRTITVKMGDAESTYDGTVYSYLDDGNLTVENEVQGEEVKLMAISYLDNGGNTVTHPINAGSYTVVFVSLKIEDGKTTNYTLSEESVLTCTLTIKKKDAEIAVYSRTIERPLISSTPVDGEDFTKSDIVSDDRDSLEYGFTYTYNGSTVTSVINIGEYTVDVLITGNGDILNNYNLSYKSGTLTVTARQVTVVPEYAGKEYDGEPIDISEITYSHYHTVKPDEIGFLYNDDDNYTINYIFNGIDGFVPTDAGTYKLTAKVTGYDENDYHIFYDEVEITISPKPITVTVSFDESVFDGWIYHKALLPTAGITATAEILDRDKASYNLLSYFYNVTQDFETAYDYAGDYEIRARLNKQNGNYFIDNTSWEAQFSVEKATLYIRPVAKSAPYDGKPLYAEEFEIFDGDNGSASSPANGDTLYARSDDVLLAHKISLLASVSSASITCGGTDVSANYTLYYSYQAFMKEKGYNTVTFKAALTHTQLTFSYYQYELAQRVFVYDGTAFDLGVEVSDSLIYGYSGLLNGDSVEVYKLMTVKNIGSYAQWVQLRFYNSAGENVTNLYKLDILNKDSSAVVVEARGLNASFTGIDDDVLADAWNGGDESILSSANSLYDGYRVLNSAYYGLSGAELLTGHEFEILVSESDGSFAFTLIIFELSNGKRSERSQYYSLNSVNADLKISLISALSTTTN